MPTVTSTNPYNGNVLATYTTHTETEISELLKKAEKRFRTWRETPFAERKKLMLAAASELKNNKQAYAETITVEMGKPIAQATAEVQKCAWLCEYYAETAESHLKKETVKTAAHKSYVSYGPIGTVLAVMPWNYPYWQVFRFAVPALMAGNIGVLKHASNVFGCAINIEKIFKRAGFPANCFTTLLVGSDAVEHIIANPIIRAITLTGSGPAGSAVAAIAGRHIKKTVLELGGNNALVVLKDCDIEKTAETCVQARFQNTGQSCIAGKRLLVDQTIHDEFLEKLLLKVRGLKSGDPMHKDTYIATMAREDLSKTLGLQVKKTLKAGAKLEIGGKRQGAYFEPTVVSGVTPQMAMFKEETFGPALAVTPFKTEEEAIALSNSSKFGLGTSIFSKNIAAAENMANRFNEGAVFINELVKSDPRLPFGGIKESGYGRELGRHGIREFVNAKTVYINR